MFNQLVGKQVICVTMFTLAVNIGGSSSVGRPGRSVVVAIPTGIHLPQGVDEGRGVEGSQVRARLLSGHFSADGIMQGHQMPLLFEHGNPPPSPKHGAEWPSIFNAHLARGLLIQPTALSEDLKRWGKGVAIWSLDFQRRPGCSPQRAAALQQSSSPSTRRLGARTHRDTDQTRVAPPSSCHVVQARSLGDLSKGGNRARPWGLFCIQIERGRKQTDGSLLGGHWKKLATGSRKGHQNGRKNNDFLSGLVGASGGSVGWTSACPMAERRGWTVAARRTAERRGVSGRRSYCPLIPFFPQKKKEIVCHFSS